MTPFLLLLSLYQWGYSIAEIHHSPYIFYTHCDIKTNYTSEDSLYEVNLQIRGLQEDNLNECVDYNELKSNSSKALLALSTWNNYTSSAGAWSWDLFLDIKINATSNIKELSITLEEVVSSSHHSTCVTIALQKNSSWDDSNQPTRSQSNVWHRITTLAPRHRFRYIKIKAAANTDNDQFFHQTLFFLNPQPTCLSAGSCALDRFVYTDITANPGKDTIHISNTSSTEDLLYSLLLTEDSDDIVVVKTFTKTSSIVEVLPQSVTKLYRILSEPRTYHTEIAAVVTAAVLITLCVAAFMAWFKSIPREKNLVVIYCQCDRHVLSANALKKIICFFEKNCRMQIREPPLYNDNQDNHQEVDVLLANQSNKTDFVAFVPFPTVEGHDRCNERDVHIQCERYKDLPKKIELKLPLEDNHRGWSPTSEWPRGTFKDFQLLQELPELIRYIHPCYYPKFLERFFRPQLWPPNLFTILKNNTYTNDHIREITDPKFNVKPRINVSTVEDQLDLDSIIS